MNRKYTKVSISTLLFLSSFFVCIAAAPQDTATKEAPPKYKTYLFPDRSEVNMVWHCFDIAMPVLERDPELLAIVEYAKEQYGDGVRGDLHFGKTEDPNFLVLTHYKFPVHNATTGHVIGAIPYLLAYSENMRKDLQRLIVSPPTHPVDCLLVIGAFIHEFKHVFDLGHGKTYANGRIGFEHEGWRVGAVATLLITSDRVDTVTNPNHQKVVIFAHFMQIFGEGSAEWEAAVLDSSGEGVFRAGDRQVALRAASILSSYDFSHAQGRVEGLAHLRRFGDGLFSELPADGLGYNYETLHTLSRLSVYIDRFPQIADALEEVGEDDPHFIDEVRSTEKEFIERYDAIRCGYEAGRESWLRGITPLLPFLAPKSPDQG